MIGNLFFAAVLQTVNFSERVPALDGVIEGDPAWANVGWSSDFVMRKTGGVPHNRSRFKALYTEDAVYVAIENFEHDMASLGQDFNKVEFWHCDVDEIFFTPRKDETIHLIFSAADNANEEIPTRTMVRTDGRTGWAAKSRLGKDRWCVEFCVPFYLLDVSPADGEVRIPFNACRNELAEKELSSWSFQSGSFKNVFGFGTLVLAPPPAERRKAVAAAAKRPHLISLLRHWRTIRKDPLWQEFLAAEQKSVRKLDAIEKLPDPSVRAAEFADLMAGLESRRAAGEKRRRQELDRQFFGE